MNSEKQPLLFHKKVKHKKSFKDYISKLTFWWTYKILKKGNSIGTIEIEDAPKIEDDLDAGIIGQKFWNAWEEHRSVWKVLTSMFGWKFFAILIALLVQECFLRLCSGIILGFLIKLLEGPINLTLLITWSLLFSISLIFNTFVNHLCVFEARRVGMTIRIGLTALIYQKSLLRSLNSYNKSGGGQVTNILSNDLNRFNDQFENIFYVIISPIQILTVSGILYSYIGISSIVGALTSFAILPIYGLLAVILGYFRKNVAKLADIRIKTITELLSNITTIKMLVWESIYKEKINAYRSEELRNLKLHYIFQSFNFAILSVSSRVSVLLILIVYVVSGNLVSPNIVFVIFTLYNLLRNSLGINFPIGVSLTSEIIVAVRRIQNQMMLEEMESEFGSQDFQLLQNEITPKIELKNFNGISENGAKTLKNFNLSVSSGELIGIVGNVGSGKTLLLYAILGEVPGKLVNSVTRIGKIGYVSQSPWLISGTLRENILFGNPYIPSWYEKVVEACGLTSDISMFPEKDATFVGENGIALSGGQKARVGLARAVYLDADIYLLDDPLSALDVKVGNHVMDKCINGLLSNKCVVLVTHQVHLLKNQRVKQIYLLENCEITIQGKYEDIYGLEEDTSKTDTNLVSTGLSLDEITIDDEIPKAVEDDPNQGHNPRLVKKLELRRQGRISWKLICAYIRSGNSAIMIFWLCLVIPLAQLFQNCADFWLKLWVNWEYTSTNLGVNGEHRILNNTVIAQEYEHVLIFGLLVTLIFTFVVLRAISVSHRLLASSKALHSRLFNGILKSTIEFFQTNSTGVLLKLFSNETGVLDERLPFTISAVIATFCQVVGSLVIICIMDARLTIVVVLFLILCYYTEKFYLSSAGIIKRLEGSLRSPILGQMDAITSGIVTIRAFNSQQYFYNKFIELQNKHTSVFYVQISAHRWIILNQELLNDLYVIVVMAFLMYMRADPSTLGLAVSSSLLIITMGTGFITMMGFLPGFFVSAELLIDYSHIPSEGRPQKPYYIYDRNWPKSGKMDFKNVTVAYGTGPNVLNSINFSIENSEKIGIVGRTGAGKSSLIAAIFRLVEPKQGSIHIDGFNVQDLLLENLRLNLSIIPQNPLLFDGTIRRNVDPFSEFSDENIWRVLDIVKLSQRLQASNEGLNLRVIGGGSNFSQGEKQLISLARTILKIKKIVILDEATANIDNETDTVIQNTIRQVFKNSTVLTIAHRLETVIDSDRIMVLHKGEIMEFDTPINLLNDDKSFLSRLVQKTGKSNYLKQHLSQSLSR